MQPSGVLLLLQSDATDLSCNVDVTAHVSILI